MWPGLNFSKSNQTPRRKKVLQGKNSAWIYSPHHVNTRLPLWLLTRCQHFVSFCVFCDNRATSRAAPKTNLQDPFFSSDNKRTSLFLRPVWTRPDTLKEKYHDHTFQLLWPKNFSIQSKTKLNLYIQVDIFNKLYFT
jgi:hypothetical protein